MTSFSGTNAYNLRSIPIDDGVQTLFSVDKRRIEAQFKKEPPAQLKSRVWRDGSLSTATGCGFFHV